MKKKYDPTDEQRAVIQTTDRTLLLSAAAGSGKTATLTNRLIAMITRKDRPLDVTRMLVVTFTRAAAEDLRVQIAAALAEAVAADPENTHLANQQLLLPSAHIRTIDAFCNDLVKSHVEKLGISPLYRIADEAELDLLALSLLDDLIEEAYSGTFAPEGLDIATVAEIAESVKKSGTLAEQLYQLYSHHLHGIPNGVASLEQDATRLLAESETPFFQTRFGSALAAWYKENARHARELLMAAEAALPRTAGSENLFFAKQKQKYFYLLDLYERIAEACDLSLDALRETLASVDLPKNVNTPKEGTQEELFFKSLVTDVKDAVFATDPSVKDAGVYARTVSWSEESLSHALRRTAEITHSVYLLLAEFEARLNKEKRRRAIFDHSDITAFTYTLLCDEGGGETPLARELRAAFDTVCIDEYQDVNEIQHRIFEVISTERNRFMVGDIKQSIYAFRGAVPEIFSDLRKRMPPLVRESAEQKEAVLYLTRNFRSEKPVIDFANHVFDFLFPIIEDSIGYRPKEDRLNTKKEGGVTPTPTLHLFKASKDTENDQIAKKILSLLKDCRLASGAPVRPSDIAVLTRKNDAELVEALRKHGIPVRTEDKTDFFSRKEILLALALLHAVSNPHRDIYLCGLLRSPLYGFTADELVNLRALCREGSFYDALCALRTAPDSKEDAVTLSTEAFTLLSQKVARVLDDLSRFRRMAENTPAHRLIRTLFTETGIYSVIDGAARANLRTFYELARTFEANAFRGLYRFLDHISEMRRLGHGLPKREVGEEDAVTVSTIHHSKGLEYPVCILAHAGGSLVHRRSANDPPFSYTKGLGLLMPIPGEGGLSLMETPLFVAEQCARRQAEMEEAVRVLYVALTRPKEQLFVFVATGASGIETYRAKAYALSLLPTAPALHTYASYGIWMLAALMKRGEGEETCHVLEEPPFPTVEEETDADAPAAENTAKEIPLEDVAEQLRTYRERFSFRYPHEAQTRLPAKLSVSKLRPDLLDGVTASPFDRPLFEEEEEVHEEAATEIEAFRPTLPRFIGGTEDNTAARAGTATHVFLQFCDFDRILSRPPCEDVIGEELARLSSLGFLPKTEAEHVRTDELTAFLSSDLAEVLRTAREALREFRFHALLPAEQFASEGAEALTDSTVFVQGVIDLLVRRADGSLLLVDYKTDRVWERDERTAAKRLFARHGTQLSVYADAVARMLNERPAIALYSLPLGKLVFPPRDTEDCE